MILALLTIHLLSGDAPPDAVKLEQPGVDYRVEVAGATAAPWVLANGWRFQRDQKAAFVSDASGAALPLAMAEAFAWHGNVWFQVSDQDRPVFDQTLAFFTSLPPFSFGTRAQIGVEEDGTADTGEVLKLLARRNLMAAPHLKAADLKVKPDKDAARNPAQFAASVRKQLGDDNRLLRIYGTDVVLGSLEGDTLHTRLHLVNYSNHEVNGVRVRVLGNFAKTTIWALGQPGVALRDITNTGGGTEFTVPVLARYAAIDLTAELPVLTSRRSDHEFKLSANPGSPEWRNVPAVLATQTYTGATVPLLPTKIQSRWTDRNLYLLFSCPYDSLHLKPGPNRKSETPKLWDWDVAEAFIGPEGKQYREFQVSPQGEWIDLAIDRVHPLPDGGMSWNSGFTVKARIDSRRKIWYGEMKIPRSAFPDGPLRLGLFRMQGEGEHKHEISWQPTGNPSFHVPEAFGTLRLEQ